MRVTRKDAIYLAAGMMLVAMLACNLSTPKGPTSPTSEAAAVTTAEPNLAEAPAQNSNTEVPTDAQPSPTLPSSGDSSNPENGTPEVSIAGVGPTSLIDDIFTSISVKNGNESYEGNIAFPGTDTSDEIHVKPIDLEGEEATGNLTFTLNCSGRGKAKVGYKGGMIVSGVPGCGETWTIYVIHGSPDSQISIRLDATGAIDWTLTVTSGR